MLNDTELKTVKNYFKTKYNASVDIGVISNVVKTRPNKERYLLCITIINWYYNLCFYTFQI